MVLGVEPASAIGAQAGVSWGTEENAERSNAHALRYRGRADVPSCTEAVRRKGREAVAIAASGNQVGDQAGGDRRQSEAEMTMTEGMDHPGAAT